MSVGGSSHRCSLVLDGIHFGFLRQAGRKAVSFRNKETTRRELLQYEDRHKLDMFE